MAVNIYSLHEILNRVEFENLLLEGRDPVEVLHYKFSYIPSNIIDSVIKIDPTKKKSYSQWLLSKWKSEKGLIVKSLEDGRLEKLFNHYKTHPEVQIKDCPSLEEGLRQFAPIEDTVLSKSKEPMTYVENLGEEVDSRLANDFDVVYEDDKWLIAVPNTYEAECKLGENMRWCTANEFGNGRSYYENYLESGGKFYVNFDKTKPESRNGKDYPYTRYQFHFESNQFMDKDDKPVTLDEIGIPDGAIKFYESEGYDASDFENLEVKIERYEDWRYQNAYFCLNDELGLCVQYDNDYQPEEINDDTPFFVFDDSDSRDPISYVEITNPFTNENTVRLNKANYLVLEEIDGDEFMAVINETNKDSSWYRLWESYAIDKWLELPDEAGLFCSRKNADNDMCYTVLSTYGENMFKDLTFDSCDGMFINKPCTSADKDNGNRVFIECITDGYHSLFAIGYGGEQGISLDCIIKRDNPKNGTEYVIEGNAIEGTYGRYRVFGDVADDDTEYSKYTLEDELENGDYIVSHTFTDGEKAKTMVNVLRKGEKEPLLNEWVDAVIDFDSNVYITKRGNRFGLFGLNGELIGQWYSIYGVLDRELSVIVGQIREGDEPVKTDFINGQEGKVFATFKSFLTNYQANHQILVVPFNDDGTEGNAISFNYETRQYTHPEIASYQKIIPFNDKNFLCTLSKTNERVIYNFKEQRVVADNVQSVSVIRSSDLFKLVNTNGKENLFRIEDSKVLLPNYVDSIIEAIDYRRVVLYEMNGRSYIYNFEKNKMLGNPNGVDLKLYLGNDGYYVYSDDNFSVRFYISENDMLFKGWFDNLKRNYGYSINENTPQEVVMLYNKVVGEDNQQKEVYEAFQRLMNRIDEASKKLHARKMII